MEFGIFNLMGRAPPPSRQRRFSPKLRTRRGSLTSSATRSPGSPSTISRIIASARHR
jgi:hypothetical protein